MQRQKSKEICNKILEDVSLFSAMGIYSDDRTLVAIKELNKYS